MNESGDFQERRAAETAASSSPHTEYQTGAHSAQSGPAAPPYEPAWGAAPNPGAAYGAAGAPPPPPPSGYGYTVPPAPGLPNPATAFVLGFIPGVGAMYNGQFAKGIANIVIFAVLVSMSNNVNGIFGLLVAGWVFFMVFDAYQTARARRFGLPLPNPFGLNDLGDRLGFGAGQGWGAAAAPGVPPAGAAPGTPAPDPAAAYVPADPVAAYASPASYVPADPVAAYVPPASAYTGGYAQTPYAAPPQAVPPYPPPPDPAVPYQATYNPYASPADFAAAVPPRSGLASIPAGAIWLIALGTLALAASIRHDNFLGGDVLISILLLAFAAFLAFRRWQGSALLGEDGSVQRKLYLLHGIRFPLVVAAVAVLNLISAVRLLRWEASWPILLIFIGVVLIVERVVGQRLAAEAADAQAYAAANPPAADPAPASTYTATETGEAR